jgi:hypothetical protein
MGGYLRVIEREGQEEVQRGDTASTTGLARERTQVYQSPKVCLL